MTERIVDVLETIDVEIKKRDRRGTLPDRGKLVIEPVIEQRPVGKSGQRIMEGKVLRLRPAGMKLKCAAANPRDENSDDCRNQQNGDYQYRHQTRVHRRSRRERMPGEIAKRVSRTIAERQRSHAAPARGRPGETRAVEVILPRQSRQETAVQIAHADVEEDVIGPLRDFAGFRHDRLHTDDRGAAVHDLPIGGARALHIAGFECFFRSQKLSPQLHQQRPDLLLFGPIARRRHPPAQLHRIDGLVGGIEYVDLVVAVIGMKPNAEIIIDPAQVVLWRLQPFYGVVP